MATYTVCVKRGKRTSYEVQKLIEEALRKAGLSDGLEVHPSKYNKDEDGNDLPDD